VVWVEDSDLSALSSSMVSDMDSTSSGPYSEGLMEEVSSLAPPRRRGRPRKADTPLVVDQVKRCTSTNNKEGYRQMSLPDGPTVRKASKR
jgi:hypothetical protein